jgi:hypothetical protein
VKDVAEFYTQYTLSDLVGQIANLHLRWADLKGADCSECIKLAELSSWAVDFQKTGTPLPDKNLPYPKDKVKPDFMSHEDGNLRIGDFYRSPNLLGRLFRGVSVRRFSSSTDSRCTPADGKKVLHAFRRLNVEDMGLPILGSIDQPSALFVEMEGLAMEFCDKLKFIAQVHTMSKRADVYLSEAELVSGTIQASWNDDRKRRDSVAAMNTQVTLLSVVLDDCI